MNMVYVGCRTTKERGGTGKGISCYRVCTDGTWKLLSVEEAVNPSYLCTDLDRKFLYAIHGDLSSISAYRILSNGTLTHLNTVSTYGTNPVHLSVDKSSRWLFVANLQTGSVAVLPRNTDGSLGNIHEIQFLDGNGGPGYISHPHQVMQDRTGNYLIVSAQGRMQGVGKVTVFHINSESGHLTEICRVKAREGAEPRHCVFSSDNHFCYGVNEKGCTVTVYAFDETCGALTPVQVVSTLPESCVDGGWSSGIDLSKDGRTLYVSDRKQDAVSVMRVDPATGHVALTEMVSALGRQPRYLGVSSSGKELIVAHERSNTVTAFPISSVDGSLGKGVERAQTGSPVCVLITP